ncbi:MAG: phosphoglucosamine mutase [Acidobacteria bacterium]|nr:phosphoglucosamine mutase [Acidobacteriota bacterium]
MTVTSSTMFGTDGVRGIPGTAPLDERTLVGLGVAVVRTLGRDDAPVRVCLGRDTRESGPWVAQQLVRGLVWAGAQVTDGGVLSTPALACATRDGGFDAGLVVSASHNPFQDNGVKVFTRTGEKADDDLESRLAATALSERWSVPPAAEMDTVSESVAADYVTRVSGLLDGVSIPAGFRLVLDCANGATSVLAPQVFRAAGLGPTVLHDRPDGRNINLACGSTHPESLAHAVVDQQARLGAAFDGDGDRVVFVDHRGAVVDGDAVLLIAARRLLAAGRLPHRGVVATVMSNIGLDRALRADGMALHRCAVGDRAVWSEMTRRGLGLGGEQSGHIIVADHLPTGDGLATALLIIRAVIETGRELSELAAALVASPQVLVNVRVRERVPLDALPAVSRLVRAAERQLADDGRVLVRYSGTEPLLRVMIEGPDQTTIQGLADEIAGQAEADVGLPDPQEEPCV